MKRIEELYQKYNKQIYAYFFHLTYNHDAANDLTQETFYQVIISIPRFKGKSKVSTWIYGIARNTYLKHLQKEKKYIPTEEKDFYSLVCADTNKNPESVIHRKEVLEDITIVINSLPENYATVLILRDKNGLSYKEIAEITGMTETSVKATLFRARKRFQETYTKQKGGE